MKNTKVVACIQAPIRGFRLWREAEEIQNYYHICRKAAKIAEQKNLEVLALCGWAEEAEIYRRILQDLGVKHFLIESGIMDVTIQAGRFLEIAREENSDLILVCDWSQFLRMWYECQGRQGIGYRLVAGWPNFQEVATNFVLFFLFPFIDLLGLRRYYQKRVTKRRARGKL